MKRNIQIWAILSIALFSCSTSQKYGTSTSYSLKGNVKTATEIHYDAYLSNDAEWTKGELIVGGSNNHEKKYFDIKGRFLSKEFLTEDREVRANYSVTWSDKKDQIIEEAYSKDGEIIYYGKYSYPRKNFHTVDVYTKGSAYISQRFETNTDEKGRETDALHQIFDESGNVLGTTQISSKYDKGLESEFIFQTDDHRPNYHFRYTYLAFDKEGNWIKALKEDLLSNKNSIIEREIEYYTR